MEEYEYPLTTTCRLYEQLKEKFGDYNLIGQIKRMECQLTLTDFDDPVSVEQLKRTVRDSIKILKDLYE